MPSELHDELTLLLSQWSSGEINEQDVHERVEEIVRRTGLEALDRSDPASIPTEVLSQLDILNHQLITSADIPAIIRFLDDGLEDPTKAWSEWDAYWSDLNIEQRRSELRDNPYYIC